MQKLLRNAFYFTFLIIFAASECASASEQSFLSKISDAISDKFYGLAFRYTSVTTNGSQQGDVIPYFQHHLSNRFTANSINVNNQHVQFWESKTPTSDQVKHIVLLPFSVGNTSVFDFFTLNPSSKLVTLDELKSSSFLCSIFQELFKTQKNLIIHLLSNADVVEEKQSVHEHMNYMQIRNNRTAGTQIQIFEPWPSSQTWGDESYDVKRLTQLKATLKSNNFNADIRLITRGDQIENDNDCARFSLIYLMYALEGKSVEHLTAKDIYNGIHRFVLGPRGYLSFQREKITPQEFEERVLRGQIPQDLKEHAERLKKLQNDDIQTLEQAQNETNLELLKYHQNIGNVITSTLLEYFQEFNGQQIPEHILNTAKDFSIEQMTPFLDDFMTYSRALSNGLQERRRIKGLQKTLCKIDLHKQLEQRNPHLKYTPSFWMKLVQNTLYVKSFFIEEK